MVVINSGRHIDRQNYPHFLQVLETEFSQHTEVTVKLNR